MMKRSTLLRIGLPAALAFLLLIAPLWIGGSPYIMHLAITAFYYAILAASWSLLAGYAGQFSFAHMSFMAIGAYAAALYGTYIRITTVATETCREIPFFGRWLVILDPIGISQSSQTNCLDLARQTMPAGSMIIQPSIWWGLLFGVVAGGLFGLLIGALVLRLRSTYLALFTIGFSEILRAVISAEIDITQGQSGLEMAPLFPNGITLFGHSYSASDKIPPYYVMLALFLIIMLILSWVVSSRIGLFIRAIREDQEASAALGVHVVRYKVLVFTITAMMAAAAGVIQGHYIGIITPNILIILQMSLVIAMAVIGGLENIYAAAIGAVILLFGLELLRNSFTIGPVTIDMTTWRLVAFGLVLMITLRFFRNGLISPLIDRVMRRNVARETVALRNAATAAATPTATTAGEGGSDE